MFDPISYIVIQLQEHMSLGYGTLTMELSANGQVSTDKQESLETRAIVRLPVNQLYKLRDALNEVEPDKVYESNWSSLGARFTDMFHAKLGCQDCLVSKTIDVDNDQVIVYIDLVSEL